MELRSPNTSILKKQFWDFEMKCRLEREAKKTTKKRSLRNEKLKANRASVTEEQRRERLRIRREKDRAKRTKKTTRGRRKGRQSEDNENQRQATLKRLKRGDENDLREI